MKFRFPSFLWKLVVEIVIAVSKLLTGEIKYSADEPFFFSSTCITHYSDVKMGTIASKITSLTIVYSTVYSDANHRKHQSSASLSFVRGIHRGPVNSPRKWPVTRKIFPFDDVIMLCLTDGVTVVQNLQNGVIGQSCTKMTWFRPIQSRTCMTDNWTWKFFNTIELYCSGQYKSETFIIKS